MAEMNIVNNLTFFGAGVLTQLLALGVLTFPLFALPIIMKMAGGMLERFGAVVNNRNKGLIDRSRKKGREMYERGDYAKGRAIRKQADSEWRNKRFSDRMAKNGGRRVLAEGLPGLKDRALAAANKDDRLFSKDSKIDQAILRGIGGSAAAQRSAIDRSSKGVVATATSQAVKDEIIRLEELNGGTTARSPQALAEYARGQRSMDSVQMRAIGEKMLSLPGGKGEFTKLIESPTFMSENREGVDGIVQAGLGSTAWSQAHPDISHAMKDHGFGSKAADQGYVEGLKTSFDSTPGYNWAEVAKKPEDALKVAGLKAPYMARHLDPEVAELALASPNVGSADKETVDAIRRIAKTTTPSQRSGPPPSGNVTAPFTGPRR